MNHSLVHLTFVWTAAMPNVWASAVFLWWCYTLATTRFLPPSPLRQEMTVNDVVVTQEALQQLSVPSSPGLLQTSSRDIVVSLINLMGLLILFVVKQTISSVSHGLEGVLHLPQDKDAGLTQNLIDAARHMVTWLQVVTADRNYHTVLSLVQDRLGVEVSHRFPKWLVHTECEVEASPQVVDTYEYNTRPARLLALALSPVLARIIKLVVEELPGVIHEILKALKKGIEDTQCLEKLLCLYHPTREWLTYYPIRIGLWLGDIIGLLRFLTPRLQEVFKTVSWEVKGETCCQFFSCDIIQFFSLMNCSVSYCASESALLS